MPCCSAIAAALVLVLDQLTKVWALRSLTPGEPVDLVGSLIRLNLIRNPGAAFSIGNGATWVLTLIACGVLVWSSSAARRWAAWRGPWPSACCSAAPWAT